MAAPLSAPERMSTLVGGVVWERGAGGSRAPTSGNATCTGVLAAPDGTSAPVRDGGALSTAVLGDHELRVRATDRAGNVHEVSRSYTVADGDRWSVPCGRRPHGALAAYRWSKST
jgi:hypothetical protein